MGESRDRFLRGECSRPTHRLLRTLLIPSGILYGCASGLVLRLRAARPRERLPVPVISVGNIEAGGTGKTPAVRWLARRLASLGERPLVVTRGYRSEEGLELGDEGESLRREGISVVAGRNRTAAAREGLRGPGGGSVVILDDGGQALRDVRDLDILLVDGRRPFGGGWPLPAGSLREFPRGLARADLVLLTRCDGFGPEDFDRTQARLRRYTKAPVAVLEHRACSLLPGGRGLDAVAGRRVFLAAGVARPAGFRATALDLGAKVEGERWFPDHHAYSAEDLRQLRVAAQQRGAEWILTTGKDFSKLQRLPEDGIPVLAIEVEASPAGDCRDLVEDMLAAALARARKRGCHGA